MPAAPHPPNEASRHAAFMGYHLHTNVLGDPSANELVRAAALHFDVPQSAIALIGSSTVYFLAAQGFGFQTMPRYVAFCSHAIHDTVPLIIEDASIDCRLADNPLVAGPPFVRFYAGAPLVDEDGYCPGTFCLVDLRVRRLDPGKVADLVTFSRQAMARVRLLSVVAEMLYDSRHELLV